MDIKRSILFVALAIVSYTLVIQWNKDYGQPQTTPTHTTSPASGLPDTSVPNTTSLGNADVPRTETPGLEPQPQVKASAQVIHVKTDVLDVAIDPKGGDLVGLGLTQYPLVLNQPDQPFPLFERSQQRTYLAQSGLAGQNGPDSASTGRPLYSSQSSSYSLADGQQQLQVDLNYAENGVSYIKRFTFHRGMKLDCTEKERAQKKLECINSDAYQIQVTYLIDNQSSQPWSAVPFAQLKRDGSADPSSTTATGLSTYLGAALWTPDKPYVKVSMDEMDEKPLNESIQGGWVAWLQHYFVTAWVPAKGETHQVTTRKDSQGNYIIGFTAPVLNLAPNSKGEVSMVLYAGPKIQKHLGELSPGLELTVDYGPLWFIAQPIFWLLQLIHNLVGNWGWSIILLTVVVKLGFFPLSAASYRSMARMRAVSPKMQALKEQYGDDRQKMSQAMMELYKKEKINPLGGCLPILVQMPVFLSLYWVLLESVEIRQAPWLGWINDLAVMDPYFILPIIMGATMLIQQMLNPTPPDPMQARVMKMMPIIFTFFFLWFPAGLVLYWVVNNCLSIAQQWYITQKVEKATKA